MMMLLDSLLSNLAALGRATLILFWIPVLMWTVWVGPVLVFVDRLGMPPLLVYRLRQGLLALLPLSIGGTALGLGAWASSAGNGAPLPAVLPDVAVSALSTATASATSAPLPDIAWASLGGLTLCVGLWGAAALVRLSADIWQLLELWQRLHNTTHLLSVPPDLVSRLPRRVKDVRLSSDDPVPMAVGLLSPIIILPQTLTSQPDSLRMALAHEAVHLRRYDDWACVMERTVLALFCWHPVAVHLGRQLPLNREQACDAAVLDETHASIGRYARLLAQTSGALEPNRMPHMALPLALPLSDTSSSLLQRLQTMKNRSAMPHLSSRRTHVASLVACAALLLTIAACSDSVTPKSDTAAAPVAPRSMEGSEPPNVDRMPRPVGGLTSLYEHVTYPEEATQQGIEGQVFVQFVVTKNGSVINASVVRGAHSLLDQAAVNAVRSMTFEPGLRDGRTVQTQMTLPITFRLDDDANTP